MQEATTHWCFCSSLSTSLPLCLKININKIFKKKTTVWWELLPINPMVSHHYVLGHDTVHVRVWLSALPWDSSSLGVYIAIIKTRAKFICYCWQIIPLSTLYNRLTPFLANTKRWLVQPHYQLSEHGNKHFLKCDCKKKSPKEHLIWKEPTAKHGKSHL